MLGFAWKLWENPPLNSIFLCWWFCAKILSEIDINWGFSSPIWDRPMEVLNISHLDKCWLGIPPGWQPIFSDTPKDQVHIMYIACSHKLGLYIWYIINSVTINIYCTPVGESKKLHFFTQCPCLASSKMVSGPSWGQCHRHICMFHLSKPADSRDPHDPLHEIWKSQKLILNLIIKS